MNKARSKPKALITGGTGALGRAVTKALAAASYEVHVTSEFPDHAKRFNSDPAFRRTPAHVVDLTDPADVRKMLKKVGGSIAALVCCAGGYEGAPMGETAPEVIDKMIRMNLKTAMVALREAHPYLKKAKGASVVLISARGALKGGPGAAVYAATKAGVGSLALSLGEEWVEDDIRVNAILPSIMDTQANRQAMPDADFSRWPKTEEVAGVIAFLVSDKAKLISGGAIPVYGKG